MNGMKRQSDDTTAPRTTGKTSETTTTTTEPPRSVTRCRKRVFYIGGHNGVAHIESALVHQGMKRTNNPDSFFLKWVECQNTINYSLFSPGVQLVNHVENIFHLTRKNCLWQTLKEYESSMKRKGEAWKVEDICMETYHVDVPEEYEKFKTIFKPGELWICKPYGRNQGKGIFMLNDLKQLEEKQKSATGSARSKRLIQRYIKDPFLIRGYKFDVRAYMLIASTDPYMVFYHPGYVRQSCVPYTTDTLDVHVHLTNQYVQKKHHLYAEMKEETVMSFEQLNEYINAEAREEKFLVEDWVYNWFVPSMKDVMLTTFKAVKHKLRPKVGVFELLGFDFMIDADMKLWLIEVNINPALHSNCNVLKEVIPLLVRETLDVVVEVFDKKTKGKSICPLQNVVALEPLYNAVTRFEFEAKRHGASKCKDAF